MKDKIVPGGKQEIKCWLSLRILCSVTREFISICKGNIDAEKFIGCHKTRTRFSPGPGANPTDSWSLSAYSVWKKKCVVSLMNSAGKKCLPWSVKMMKNVVFGWDDSHGFVWKRWKIGQGHFQQHSLLKTWNWDAAESYHVDSFQILKASPWNPWIVCFTVKNWVWKYFLSVLFERLSIQGNCLHLMATIISNLLTRLSELLKRHNNCCQFWA